MILTKKKQRAITAGLCLGLTLAFAPVLPMQPRPLPSPPPSSAGNVALTLPHGEPPSWRPSRGGASPPGEPPRLGGTPRPTPAWEGRAAAL